MNQNSSVRKLARCGVVAAIYVVLCLALQPLSYGAVQVRVAEALCLLPVFGTEYILSVVLGCFLANLLGSTIVDVIFGTLATLLACLVTYRLRNIRFKGLALAASLPPVLLSGDHAKVDKWRHEQSLIRTYNKRPDILESIELSKKDSDFLKSYIIENSTDTNIE